MDPARNSTASDLHLGGARNIKSLVYHAEVEVSKLLGLGQRSIRLLDASSHRERDISFCCGRHGKGKILMSQLGYKSALVLAVSWRASISDLDFRNGVVDLYKKISVYLNWKTTIRYREVFWKTYLTRPASPRGVVNDISEDLRIDSESLS